MTKVPEFFRHTSYKDKLQMSDASFFFMLETFMLVSLPGCQAFSSKSLVDCRFVSDAWMSSQPGERERTHNTHAPHTRTHTTLSISALVNIAAHLAGMRKSVETDLFSLKEDVI